MISALLLLLVLLSACGQAKPAEHAEGHAEGHGGHSAAEQTAAEGYQASFSFAGGNAKANETKELTIRITDRGGKPVNDFTINHEKLLHLIVISRDLTFFNHIHPDYRGNGTFTVPVAFPAGGDYKLFADFVPQGGAATTIGEWMKAEGGEAPQTAIKADSEMVKTVAGKEVELALSGAKAKEDVSLTFRIRDAATKKAIDNLEPYLGAVGHVVIVSSDVEQYIHVHPADEKSTGPEARFIASFPNAGTYKIWGQFQHQGQLFTVPFTVDIR